MAVFAAINTDLMGVFSSAFIGVLRSETVNFYSTVVGGGSYKYIHSFSEVPRSPSYFQAPKGILGAFRPNCKDLPPGGKRPPPPPQNALGEEYRDIGVSLRKMAKRLTVGGKGRYIDLMTTLIV
jgi:hypothetical protein